MAKLKFTSSTAADTFCAIAEGMVLAASKTGDAEAAASFDRLATLVDAMPDHLLAIEIEPDDIESAQRIIENGAAGDDDDLVSAGWLVPGSATIVH